MGFQTGWMKMDSSEELVTTLGFWGCEKLPEDEDVGENEFGEARQGPYCKLLSECGADVPNIYACSTELYTVHAIRR